MKITENKVIILYILAGLIMVLAVLLFFRPKTAGQNLVLYTRTDCPHCQNVEQFMTENKVKERIFFVTKEIHDQQNSTELIETARRCQLSDDEIGVPLLWDGAQCYKGDQNIINYLAARLE